MPSMRRSENSVVAIKNRVEPCFGGLPRDKIISAMNKTIGNRPIPPTFSQKILPSKSVNAG